MKDLIEAARQKGFKTMTGVILADNRNMRALAEKLGFSVDSDPADASLLLAEMTL